MIEPCHRIIRSAAHTILIDTLGLEWGALVSTQQSTAVLIDPGSRQSEQSLSSSLMSPLSISLTPARRCVRKELAFLETMKTTVIQGKKRNISGARRFIENLLQELYRELVTYLVRSEARKPTSTGLIM